MNTEYFNFPEYDTNSFKKEVLNIIQKYSITHIVETGTNMGVGSTKIFAETGLPVNTIECNDVVYKIAKNNLSKYPNVVVHHGYSLCKKDIDNFLNNEYFFKNYFEYLKQNIKVDVLPGEDPKKFYIEELITNSSNCKLDSVLMECISNTKNQLIFLDSAGCLGFLEFIHILKETPKHMLIHKTLLMDDCNHIKHVESVKYLKENNLEYHQFENGRYVYVNFLENENKLF